MFGPMLDRLAPETKPFLTCEIPDSCNGVENRIRNHLREDSFLGRFRTPNTLEIGNRKTIRKLNWCPIWAKTIACHYLGRGGTFHSRRYHRFRPVWEVLLTTGYRLFRGKNSSTRFSLSFMAHARAPYDCRRIKAIKGRTEQEEEKKNVRYGP